MVNSESDWSPAPQPGDQTAPLNGRNAAIHFQSGAKSAATPRFDPGRSHRGRRIFCRICTLLVILGWGTLGLCASGLEAFDHTRLHEEMLPIFIVLCLALPFLTYSLFSHLPYLRFVAITAATLTAALCAVGSITACIEFFRWSLGFDGFLVLFGGLGVINLVCVSLATWLLRLELDLLRPQAIATALPWSKDSAPPVAADPHATATATRSAASPPPAGSQLLAHSSLALYRIISMLPLFGIGLFVCYGLTVLSRRQISAGPGFVLACTAGLLIWLTVSAWLPVAWCRIQTAGVNILGGLSVACGFASFILDERRRMGNRWNATNITFGLSDPDLTIFTWWILALTLGCLVCAATTARLLRHELAEFKVTAAPRNAPTPRPSKDEDDLTPAGDWDQSRPH